MAAPLDADLEAFLSIVLSDVPPPKRPTAIPAPVPDDQLLARAAAAHRLLRTGDVDDGPLLLSFVVWPPARFDQLAISAL